MLPRHKTRFPQWYHILDIMRWDYGAKANKSNFHLITNFIAAILPDFYNSPRLPPF